MGKNKDLPDLKKSEILALINVKLSIREIAKRCNVSIGSVINVKNGSASKRKNCQGVRKSSKRDDRKLLQHLRKDNLLTAAQL